MNLLHISIKLIRRASLFLSGLTILSGPASAMTLVYEGFDAEPGELDYTSGETSFGWKIDSGTQVDWFAWNEATVEPYHGVSDSGLSYPGLPVVGNAFVYTEEEYNPDNGNWAYRLLPKFYSYNSSGQFWLSALFEVKITGDPAGGGWIQLCLADTPNPGNQVYLGLSNAGDTMVWSGGGERLYELDASGNPINGAKWSYSEVPVEEGVPAFLVMHLDLDAKTAAFYVNPPVDSDDPGEPVAEYTMLTDFYVNKIMMWSWNNGPSVGGEGADYIGSRIDEIRVGDSYTSVAAGADITDPGVGSVDFDPPVITGLSGPAGSASSMTSINENLAQVGTMSANETVSWSISGGIDGDLFSIGLGTGGLSFKVPPDFEAPEDSNTDNRYIVSVTATDESGNESSQVVIIDVLDSTDEVAPVITGPSGAAGDLEGAITIDENTIEVATFSADESATWSISGEDRLLFTISEAGVLSFNEKPDFENPADSDGNNVYTVNVKAADVAGNGSEQLFTITVQDVDPETTTPELFSLNAGAWNELSYSWVYGLSAQWGESNYMGSLYLAYYPTYVYQMDLGWLFYAGGSTAEAYFYSFDTGWILTGESYEGYYYVYATGSWGQFTLSGG
jgi:hypothetical protein